MNAKSSYTGKYRCTAKGRNMATATTDYADLYVIRKCKLLKVQYFDPFNIHVRKYCHISHLVYSMSRYTV